MVCGSVPDSSGLDSKNRSKLVPDCWYTLTAPYGLCTVIGVWPKHRLLRLIFGAGPSGRRFLGRGRERLHNTWPLVSGGLHHRLISIACPVLGVGSYMWRLRLGQGNYYGHSFIRVCSSFHKLINCVWQFAFFMKSAREILDFVSGTEIVAATTLWINVEVFVLPILHKNLGCRHMKTALLTHN